MMGSRFIYDIESDGLLDTITQIHCLVLRDLDTHEVFSYVNSKYTSQYPCLEEGLAKLDQADFRAAHNGVEFDDVAVSRFYPQFKNIKTDFDTMVISRAVHTNLKDNDFRLVKRGKMPAECLQRPHSLKAWGYRLGNFKGDYTGGWEKWSQEMHDYCIQDTSTTLSLYNVLKTRNQMLIDTEMAVAHWLNNQKENGVLFDNEAAQALYNTLLPERMKIEHGLRQLFQPWYVGGTEKSMKKSMSRKCINMPNGEGKETITAGAMFTPIKLTEFNPSSRDHIAHVLMAKGWKPQDFTDNGKPTVSDDIIGALPYPEAKELCTYLLLDKRIGAIAEGKQAWLKLVTKEGFIHGSVNQTGTPTHRASHSNPNMTQVPSVQSPYGKECRSLFKVPVGWKLVGADVSGLELRGLGHFLYPFDGGAYAKLILEGDVHTANWKAGSPYLTSRDMAKTYVYATLYGAGAWKIGSICRPHASDEEKALIGKKLHATFLKNVPALAELLKRVHKRVDDKKPFNFVTGHEVWPTGKHSALNYLIQAWGAVICKRWIRNIAVECKRRGLVSGWDGDFAACVFAHDEVQVAVRETGGKISPEEFGKMMIDCIAPIQQELKVSVPLAGEMKVGDNWCQTH